MRLHVGRRPRPGLWRDLGRQTDAEQVRDDALRFGDQAEQLHAGGAGGACEDIDEKCTSERAVWERFFQKQAVPADFLFFRLQRLGKTFKLREKRVLGARKLVFERLHRQRCRLASRNRRLKICQC